MRTLYLLDEPTMGLHIADIERLLVILQRLVNAGNTVAVIKSADWIIDLAPKGGVAGSGILAEGIPEQVAQVENSYTGRYLRELI